MSPNCVDYLYFINIQFAVRADVRFVSFRAFSAHDEVSAIEEYHIATVCIADYAHFIVSDWWIEVTAG